MAESKSESEKTREQLLDELQQLRRRLAELEKSAPVERRNDENRISREFIDHTQRQSAAAIFTIDMDGRIKRASDGVAAISGYDLTELIDAHHSLIFNLEAHPQTSDHFLDVTLHGKVIERHEAEITHKSGCNRIIRLSAAPIFKNDGISGLVGVIEDVSAQRHAERALKNGDEKYHRLVETIPTILLVLAPDGEIVDLNAAAGSLHGCNKENAVGRNYLHDFLPAEAQEKVKKDMAGVLAGESARDYEIPVVAADGSRRVIMWNMDRLLDGEGSIVGIVAVGLDVTDQKQAEKQIRESETHYRALFQNVLDYILVLELRDNGPPVIVDANDAAFGKHGYSREELIGQPITFLDPGVSPNEMEELAHQLSSGKPFRFEREHQRKDGSVFTVEIVAQMLSIGGREILYTIERDITERKQAELAMEEQRQFLEALLDNIGEGVVSCNARGELVRFNEVARQLHGLPEEPITPEKWAEHYDLYEADGCTPLAKERIPLFRALRGERIVNQEIVVASKHGAPQWLVASGQQLRDAEGNVSGAVVSMHNITERKQIELALKESEARYRAVVQDQTEVISRFLPDGNFTFVNDVFCKFFQTSREEVLDGTWKMVALDEDALMVEEKLARLAPANPIVSIENRVKLPDGSIHWMEFINRGFFDEHGTLTEIQSVGRNITDRKLAEEALRSSESSLKEAQTIAQMGRWEFDIIGNKLQWSDTIYEIFEIDKERFGASYEAFLDAVHPDDREMVNKAYSDSLKHKKPYRTEHRLLMKDGRIKWVSEQCHTDYDSQGRALRSVGVVQDITERKLAENALQTSLRLSEFALTHSLDELLTRTLDEAEALTGSQIGFFHFLEEDQETLQLQAWSTNTMQNMCKAEGNQKHYPVDEAGVWVDCIRQRGAVIHNDYPGMPNKKGLPEGHAPVIREMVLPIIRGDRIKAIIGVGNKEMDYDPKIRQGC